MTRYSPLPSVSLDPRNEAEIVQLASQKVYEASNQTLNDFSAGNPLAALLEGQAFANGEFLFWANQLPQAILIEWIGPFLGAMRRLGSPATARLLVSIPPSDSSTTIPAGSVFTTNANLTGGESVSFVSGVDTVIPAGETQRFVEVISQYVGSVYNVAANTITGASAIGVNSLTVTNPQPAVGGSDVETYRQVQERFFTLINRKNPVSSEDWGNFFIDFYGEGTTTTVQPNRPTSYPYNYLTDYIRPNGQVSLFVLGPNATELTSLQLDRGQNIVNFSVPVNTQAHLYPITLSQVQFNLTVSVDANGSYGSNLRQSSRLFRDVLFSVLQPNNVFPLNVDPTVSDVDSAFYSDFDPSVRFVDPHIESSAAYNTPPLLQPSTAVYTQVYGFEPSEFLLNVNDLVETTLPVPTFYPVLSSFTPYSSTEKNQTVYGNLEMKQIQFLTAGFYNQGDVCYWDPDPTVGGDGQLHVILSTVSIGSVAEIPKLITDGKISPAKTYSPWTVGNTYQAVTGTGVYDPEIVLYTYGSTEFFPTTPSAVPPLLRPGRLVWVVSSNFTLQPSTNDITGAQTASVLGAPVTPLVLSAGSSYPVGTWVFTPQVGSGPDPVADPYYNYVDPRLGVVNKYGYVVSAFTFDPGTLTISEYFDSLVTQGIIREIVVQNADGGLPIFKYKPRFPVGTYLEYRKTSSGVPEFYIATSYFTPNNTDSQVLLNEGLILPLARYDSQKKELDVALNAGTVTSPVRMFTFFQGDRTYFRQGSNVISYTATQSVTPLFQFDVYLENGIFVRTDTYYDSDYRSQDYIPYFNPDYNTYAEDTILAEDGRNLYRVMKAFSPTATVTNWTNTTVTNTARIEEYMGNLLRYVNQYTCEEDILSQLGRDISAIKLGVAQITIIPKNTGRFTNSLEKKVFVWENTPTLSETPQLSWFSGTTYQFSPPDYGTGTMAL